DTVMLPIKLILVLELLVTDSYLLKNFYNGSDISTSVAKTRWVSSSTLKILPGLNWYISLNVYGDSFISLAPDQTDGDLSIVKVTAKFNHVNSDEISSGM